MPMPNSSSATSGNCACCAARPPHSRHRPQDRRPAAASSGVSMAADARQTIPLAAAAPARLIPSMPPRFRAFADHSIRPDLVFRQAQVAPMIGLAATDRIANGGRAKTRYLSTSSCAGNRAAVRPPFVFAIFGTVSLSRVLTNSVSFSEKRIGSPLCSTKNCGSNTLNQMPWR